MSTFKDTLCIIGCGTMGKKILNGILQAPPDIPLPRYIIATVESTPSYEALQKLYHDNNRVTIKEGENVYATRRASIVLICCDNDTTVDILIELDKVPALNSKVMVCIQASGSLVDVEEEVLARNHEFLEESWIIRAVPMLADLGTGHFMTAIETHRLDLPPWYMKTTEAILNQIGATLIVEKEHMELITKFNMSSPAFVAFFYEPLIDGAVAMGLPRDIARVMAYNSLQVTTAQLKDYKHPAVFKDEITSSGGPAMDGILALEEGGLRRTVIKAVKESAPKEMAD